MTQERKYNLALMPSGRRGKVDESVNLLEAARGLGVEIESICGGRQTCAKCLVRVEQGEFDKLGIHSADSHLTSPGGEEIKLLEEKGISGLRMSCAAFPRGDLVITVPEGSRAQKQIIRKAAKERVIQVDPAIRQYYVEIDPARLGQHQGDWGRLQEALADQWGLEDLSVELSVLRHLQDDLRQGEWTATVTIWGGRRVIDLKPGYQEGIYGVAVDLGSTTLAAFLCDLRTGELLASESMMNPQISYGEDLMSRISFAMNQPGGMDKLHSAIIEAINTLAARLTRQAGITKRNVHEIVLVGNTTMTHIMLGIPPKELGVAPFALANRDAMDLPARDIGLRLHPAANAHILPSQAGHVGADNVGVLIAEEPYLQEGVTLTVDVGTNAEIVLSGSGWMFSASSPTGPAFEGGQISSGMRASPGAIERVRINPDTLTANFRVIGDERWSDDWNLRSDAGLNDQPGHLAAGICGSGIIEAITQLYLAGLITADGRFNPNISCEAMNWDNRKRKGAYILATSAQSSSGKPILITQEDVRNVQLAKAALYAGAKLLMREADVKQVDQIYLAGAFGSYIDPKHAMILGLIPDCRLDRVHAVGNAAGDGARIALLNMEKRELAKSIARQVRYIETAVQDTFQEEFVNAMHLPHKTDPFPHLVEFLPEKESTTAVRRKRRYRR